MWNIFALMEFFMKKITIIILFFVAVALVSLLLLYYNQTGNIEEQNDKKYIDVTPEEAKNLIDTNPDLIVLDVSPYYNQGTFSQSSSLLLRRRFSGYSNT